MRSFRREFLDDLLSRQHFSGKVLDVGGKKHEKRGAFRPREGAGWFYLNIDEFTRPDVLCTAEAIPIADETVDCVLICETLEHVRPPELVLKECCRVLKRGGMLVVTVPFMCSIHADPGDYRRWTAEGLRMLVESVGVGGVTVTAMGGAFATIFDILRMVFYPGRNCGWGYRQAYRGLRLLRPLMKWADANFSATSRVCTTGYYLCGRKH